MKVIIAQYTKSEGPCNILHKGVTHTYFTNSTIVTPHPKAVDGKKQVGSEERDSYASLYCFENYSTRGDHRLFCLQVAKAYHHSHDELSIYSMMS